MSVIDKIKSKLSSKKDEGKSFFTLESNVSEEPIYHELSKGIVETTLTGKLWGMPLRHQTRNIQLAKYQEYYQTDEIARRAIDTYSEIACSAGFELIDVETGEVNTKEVEICKEMMNRTNGKQIVRRLITELLIFGTDFIELDIKKNKIERFVFLHPKDMRIHIDEHGNVTEISQKQTPDNPSWKGRELDNIIPITWNVVGEDPYGLGLIEPIVDLLLKKEQIQQDLAKVTHLFAHPWMIIKVGTDAYPASADAVAAVKNEMEEYKPGKYVITRHNVNFEMLTPDVQQGLQSYYEKIIDNIIIGLGVPKSFLLGGFEGSGVGSLQLRMLFERRVLELQNLISNLFENKIFPRELELAGLGKKKVVLMKWNPLIVMEPIPAKEINDLVVSKVLSVEEARRYLNSRGVTLSGRTTEEEV